MPLSTQDVQVQFENGQWDELELTLTRIVESDPADAKSAFRLANLLAYQGKLHQALRLFDLCAAQGWPGALAQNNKGVVHTWLGEARAALECFQRAQGKDKGNEASDAGGTTPECAPALYNLGVLYERLAADGGHLPWVVSEAQETGSDSSASGIAMQYFQNALPLQWPRSFSLDRPLFLWKDDVPSRFGFETVQALAEIQEAHEFYRDGLKALEEREWMRAIHLLEAAGKLWEPLSARTVEQRRRAYLEFCRQQRDEARRAWERKDYEGARHGLDSLLSVLPGLPDHAVIEEILMDEISFLVERIRTHQADGDWPALQAETAAARRIVESQGINLPRSGPDTEGGTIGTLSERLKVACRGAWERELEHLLARNDLDNAITFAEMGEWLWFGEQDNAYWRRKVFAASVEAHYQEGLRARREGRDDDAFRSLAHARDAAVRAGDPGLIQRCDLLLAESTKFTGRGSDAEEIRRLLDGGEYLRVLQMCRERLADAPEDVQLSAFRSAAIQRLLGLGEAALRNGQWETSVSHARIVLEFEPMSKRAAGLERSALELRSGQLAVRIDNILRTRGFEEARAILAKMSEMTPTHEAFNEVQRRLMARIQSAADFDAAWQSFSAAREERRQTDALDLCTRLKAIDPDSPLVREATVWTVQAMTAYIEGQSASHPDPETVERLLVYLERVLALDPDFGPANELQRNLQAAARGSDHERRLKSEDFLRRAEKACNELDPAESLNLLRRVIELDEPGHRLDAERCRDRATQLLRRQLVPLFRQRTKESLAETDRLLNVLQLWDEEAASLERETWNIRTKALEQTPQADEILENLRKSVAELHGKPLEALRVLDQRTLELKQSGLVLDTHHRRALHALRNDVFSGMSHWMRLQAGIYEAWRPGFRNLYKVTEHDPQ